ncbi:hypothetical protein GA0115246_103703 [Streptomyces sp. SolWspMP-sol7th]|nr:hypothetical protein GA0115246_103703 [Streptomyces sp. SolWspMP-sol7th]
MSRSLSLGAPPVTKACARTTERVPFGAGREVGADPVERGAEDALVIGGGGELVLDEPRFEVGQPVEGDLAVRVAQHDGLPALGGPGPQVDPGAAEQPGADTEAPRGIVVPRDEHGGHAERGEPVQRLVVQLDGGQRGHRPVVHVPGHDDGLDVPLPHRRHEVVEEGGLRVEQRHPVQRAPEVPVGGVQNPQRRPFARPFTRTPPRAPFPPHPTAT